MTKLLHGIEDYLEEARRPSGFPAGCAGWSCPSAAPSARRATSSPAQRLLLVGQTGSAVLGTVCRCSGRSSVPPDLLRSAPNCRYGAPMSDAESKARSDTAALIRRYYVAFNTGDSEA